MTRNADALVQQECAPRPDGAMTGHAEHAADADPFARAISMRAATDSPRVNRGPRLCFDRQIFANDCFYGDLFVKPFGHMKGLSSMAAACRLLSA